MLWRMFEQLSELGGGSSFAPHMQYPKKVINNTIYIGIGDSMVKYLNVPMSGELLDKLRDLKGRRTWEEFFEDVVEDVVEDGDIDDD